MEQQPDHPAPAGTTSSVPLACALNDDDLERLHRLIADAPPTTAIATWFEARGLVWCGVKVDDVLIGWLVSPATDEVEGQAIGRALAELLARGYAPARDASAAARLLIRRLAH